VVAVADRAAEVEFEDVAGAWSLRALRPYVGRDDEGVDSNEHESEDDTNDPGISDYAVN
jgi:hypothetical protein